VIVRLTDAQRKACWRHGAHEHRVWLERAERAGKVTWDIPMPPIGWKTLLDRLSQDAFNLHGQRRGRKRAGSLYRAISRIAGVLADLEAHPAFNEAALPGESTVLLLAWPGHERPFSPYPTDGGARLLVPQWVTVGGVRVTIWSPSRYFAYEEEILRPEAHLAFVTRPASDPVDATDR
jgi:hypothetical protein